MRCGVDKHSFDSTHAVVAAAAAVAVAAWHFEHARKYCEMCLQSSLLPKSFVLCTSKIQQIYKSRKKFSIFSRTTHLLFRFVIRTKSAYKMTLAQSKELIKLQKKTMLKANVKMS